MDVKDVRGSMETQVGNHRVIVTTNIKRQMSTDPPIEITDLRIVRGARHHRDPHPSHHPPWR